MSEAQVAHRLRAAIVMDYQNIHLTAHDNFEAFGTPKHHSLIHPLAYARNVIDERNRRQRSGYPHADLVKMEVS